MSKIRFADLLVVAALVSGQLCASTSVLAQGRNEADVANTAIIVGISDYDHLPARPSVPDDASLLANFLKQSAQFGTVTVVTDDQNVAGQNEDGIHGRLLAAVQESVAQPTGTLLIYYSGYAYVDEAGDKYLASAETDPERLASSTDLRISDLSKLLNTVPDGRTVLILLDCGMSPDSVAPDCLLTGRPLLAAFADSKNLVAISACSENQNSHLPGQLDGGVFAHAVTESLSGDADVNDDRSLTATELYHHLFNSMQNSCARLGVEQTPKFETFGRAKGRSEVIGFLESTEAREVTFKNREATATVVVRIDGRQIEVAPGNVVTVSCSNSSQLEFFAGTPGWKRLYKTPTNLHDFRIAQQPGGGANWTTGFTNSVGIHMTLVHPGRFTMGQNANDRRLLRQLQRNLADFANELPAHEVELTTPFFIGTGEVPVRAFRTFTQQAGYRTDAEKRGARASIFIDGTGNFVLRRGLSWRGPGFTQADDHPVVLVTWNDTTRFCNWLTLKEEWRYSLPTEAEWEYAARAGTQTVFWSGDSLGQLTQVANVRDASVRRRFPSWTQTLSVSDGSVFTSEFGKYRKNPFGLYDMHGNVWEWCLDWYDEDYYDRSPREDPKGPHTGRHHVMRGGCFY